MLGSLVFQLGAELREYRIDFVTALAYTIVPEDPETEEPETK
jgi:hypothetical protein